MSTQDALRELADDLDFIFDEYGLISTRVPTEVYFGKVINPKPLFPLLKEDNYGFIGIMSNQCRPEIYIRVAVRGITIPIYSFKAAGYNNFNGGFINEYPKMMGKLAGAPEFIKNKIKELYEYCLEKDDTEKKKYRLEQLEEEKAKLIKELAI